ncbi:hypothetical protein BDY19DRAFT_1054305 [Irpex rosettiformis]|uniref:Uncharacterized protein n=1 Tax=Irpex rosettiformis TaxID=378272 RepID=A0ACB8UEW1_9APHY|nr:hypothetical protein BDY19DRAFT_1054305 [Irpex rosettiformis]
MISKANRARFSELYHSLPQDAQQALVESHLIPMLSRTSRKRASRANAAAARLHKRHQNLPVLDIKTKKAEINLLLEELSKDSKRSFVMDISSKPEILHEIISCLTDWYDDLWSVAYEHNVQYELVHECLLLIHTTLNRLANVRSCCKCSLTSLYVPIVIKSKTGAVIKSFSIEGVQNLESVSEFIWRDMFLSMLASGKEHHEQLVLEMLVDIQRSNGWHQILRILRPAKKGTINLDDIGDDEDDWEDEDNEEEDDEDAFDLTWEEGAFGRCHHWPSRISSCLGDLRDLAEMTMKKEFEILPSSPLYIALISIADDSEGLSEELLEMIESIARVSPDTFAVALEIYSSELKVQPILNLLKTHSHLLRPRDAPSLQLAMILLGRNDHSELALSYIRKELIDTARAVKKALSLSFSRMDEPSNRTDLNQILKLRQGSTGRRNRIETWVDSITTPGADAANPMMFAAMMMGVPPMPGMNSDDDAYTYLDLDPLDPDLEDLRHEFRPALKKRFESWVNIAHMMKPGAAVLLSVYKYLIEFMPFLRAADATDEIIGRLQDRPSKQFVCDGLDALLAFTKIQKRKYNIAKTELQKRKDLEALAADSSPSASTGTSNNATPSPSGQTPDPTSAASSATPISVPVPLSTMFSAFPQGYSTEQIPVPGTAPNNTSGPSQSGASSSNTAQPSTSESGQSQSGNTVHSLLRNPLTPTASTQTQPHTLGLPFPLSTLFGAAIGSSSSAPGPSLDDVD